MRKKLGPEPEHVHFLDHTESQAEWDLFWRVILHLIEGAGTRGEVHFTYKSTHELKHNQPRKDHRNDQQ